MYASTEQRRRARVQALADELYRERYHHLLRIARANAFNRADAEEATQDAFASFIEHFDPERRGTPAVARRSCRARRAFPDLYFPA